MPWCKAWLLSVRLHLHDSGYSLGGGGGGGGGSISTLIAHFYFMVKKKITARPSSE